MKKLLSLILALSLLLSLASCGDKGNESSGESPQPSIEYADNSADYKMSMLSFFEKSDSAEYYSNKRGLYGDVYYRSLDRSAMAVRAIARLTGKPVEYYEEALQYHLEYATDEEYVNHNIGRPTYDYILIREYNIPKSLFIEENQYQKEIDEATHEETVQFRGRSYYTDNEIELLYSSDINAVIEHFATPWSIVYEGKAYPIAFFNLFDIERWEEEEIPAEKIKTFIESFVFGGYETVEIYIGSHQYKGRKMKNGIVCYDGSAMTYTQGIENIEAKRLDYEKIGG